jgi:predicted alpha/beta hydrolase
MRDRIATIGPSAAVAGAFGLCCGLPVLLSIGVVGSIAGWSLQSWALIGVGLVVAAVGWARWARSRRDDDTCRRPVSSTHEHATPDQTADSTTDATTRGTNL